MADLARPHTGGYWALPSPDHPTQRTLTGASGLGKLAQRPGRRRARRMSPAPFLTLRDEHNARSAAVLHAERSIDGITGAERRSG
jgi:hypothetical protein